MPTRAMTSYQAIEDASLLRKESETPSRFARVAGLAVSLIAVSGVLSLRGNAQSSALGLSAASGPDARGFDAAISTGAVAAVGQGVSSDPTMRRAVTFTIDVACPPIW